jgi:hypothetical protein
MSMFIRVGVISVFLGLSLPCLCFADDDVFIINNDTNSSFDVWIINPTTKRSAKYLCPSKEPVSIGVPTTYGKRRIVAISRRTGVQYELGWHDIREIVRDNHRSELKLSTGTRMENKIVDGQIITTSRPTVDYKWKSRGGED